jgi:hypothetical protein
MGATLVVAPLQVDADAFDSRRPARLPLMPRRASGQRPALSLIGADNSPNNLRAHVPCAAAGGRRPGAAMRAFRDVRFPTIEQPSSGHQSTNSGEFYDIEGVNPCSSNPKAPLTQPPKKKSLPRPSSLRKYPRATLPCPTVAQPLHWPAGMLTIMSSVRARSIRSSGHGR